MYRICMPCYRRWPRFKFKSSSFYTKRRVIAFDVDGVLEGYGGLITRNLLEKLKKDWYVGVISARGDHARVKENLNLEFSFLWDANSLERCKKKYPGMERYVYVSDNPERRPITEAHGFQFIHPRDIEQALTLAASILPFQLELSKVVLVMALNIANFFDYYTTKKALEKGLGEGNPFARYIMKLGWRKYQLVKFGGVAAWTAMGLMETDPNRVSTYIMGIGVALLTYAAINNFILMQRLP